MNNTLLKTFFRQSSKPYTNSKLETTYYSCRVESEGTKCFAFYNITKFHKSPFIKVNYCLTHSHELYPSVGKITKEEKTQLVFKIKQKIPIGTIYQEILYSIHSEITIPFQLITKSYLRNLKKK